MNFTRPTRIPENSAAVWLFPMAIDGAPETRRMKQNAEGNGEQQEEYELEGEHPPDIALPEEGEFGGIAIVRLVTKNDEGNATIKAHGSDGDDDGGQAKPRHEHAVECAAEQPDSDAYRRHFDRSGSELKRVAHSGGGESDDCRD